MCSFLLLRHKSPLRFAQISLISIFALIIVCICTCTTAMMTQSTHLKHMIEVNLVL